MFFVPGLVASDLMWDGILNSVPDIDDAAARSELIAPTRSQSGTYRFDDQARLRVGRNSRRSAPAAGAQHHR